MNCKKQQPFFDGIGLTKPSNLTNNFGFTVVELMVSIALLAISAALALPSYRDMIEKRQLTHGAEQLTAFINSAQSEATKLNQIVTVSYARSDDQNWCAGVNVGATPCDCNQTSITAADFCAVNGAPRLISDAVAGDMLLLKSMTGDAGDDSAYSYDPVRGLLVNLDDALNIEMHSQSSKFQLEMRVSRTGQTEVCSKNSGHSIPGYVVCS